MGDRTGAARQDAGWRIVTGEGTSADAGVTMPSTLRSPAEGWANDRVRPRLPLAHLAALRTWRPSPRDSPWHAWAPVGGTPQCRRCAWSLRAPVNGLLTMICSKKLNCAPKILNSKVEIPTILYNNCKG